MDSIASPRSRDAAAAGAASAARAARIADDKAMLRAAADLTRDLQRRTAGDLLGRSARVRGARLWRACRGDRRAAAGLAIVAGVVAVLALYRAGSFIHELTHIKH